MDSHILTIVHDLAILTYFNLCLLSMGHLMCRAQCQNMSQMMGLRHARPNSPKGMVPKAQREFIYKGFTRLVSVHNFVIFEQTKKKKCSLPLPITRKIQKRVVSPLSPQKIHTLFNKDIRFVPNLLMKACFLCLIYIKFLFWVIMENTTIGIKAWLSYPLVNEGSHFPQNHIQVLPFFIGNQTDLGPFEGP